jgi:hypothetical protein
MSLFNQQSAISNQQSAFSIQHFQDESPVTARRGFEQLVNHGALTSERTLVSTPTA